MQMYITLQNNKVFFFYLKSDNKFLLRIAFVYLLVIYLFYIVSDITEKDI